LSDRCFHIDPDIAKASTPPSWIYTDANFYDRAREKVFARSWQFVGDVSDAKVPGQLHPFTMLEGCLDERLLLVRDRDDRLYCMSNVCTHRGMLVCEEGGVENHLRCRYHGRRFGLDGKFASMPEFEGTVNFPTKADDLPQVQLAQWGTFLFAALDPMCSFDDWIGPMRQRIGWLPINECKLDATRSRDYLVACNWA
jgi:choline monooxygenase